MAESILSVKNQIVVPKEARHALGLEPGDKLLIVVRGKSVIVLKAGMPWCRHAGIGKADLSG